MGFPETASIVCIVAVLGGALFYIVRSKRKGKGCIGCPYADGCSGRCSSQTDEEK